MARPLPTELIIEIVTLSSKSDLPTLGRTSEMFRDIAEPLLYHDICISSREVDTQIRADDMFSRLVCLYQILQSPGHKAAMVRRMEVDLPMCVQAVSEVISTCLVLPLTSCIFSTAEISEGRTVPHFTPINHTPTINDSMFTRYNELSMIPTVIAAVLSVLPNLMVLHLSDPKETPNPHAPSCLIALLQYIFCPALENFS